MNLTKSLLFIVLTIVFLVPPAGAMQEDLHDPDELDRAIALINELQRKRVRFDVEDQTIEAMLRQLSTAGPCPITADYEVLASLGSDQWTEQTHALGIASIATILDAIAHELGDTFDHVTWDINNGRVVLTTMDATSSMGLVGTYDVRNLLAQGAAKQFRNQTTVEVDVKAIRKATEVPTSIPHDGRRPGIGDLPPDQVKPPDAVSDDDDGENDAASPFGELPLDMEANVIEMTPAEAFLDLVIEHVDTEAWIAYGGHRAMLTEHAGAVVVTAPPRVHMRLRTLLEQLEQSHPTSLEMDVSILSIDDDRLEALRRTASDDTMRLARTLLRDDSATVMFRSAMLTTGFGKTLHSESEEAGTRIDLELRPDQDAATGVIDIEIGVSVNIDSASRSVRTTAAIATRRQAVVIEIPGATVSEKRMMLVIIPRRR